MNDKREKEKLERHMNSVLTPLLEAQNQVYGPYDHAFVGSLLSEKSVERALDIGTGDGSFILELARKTPDVEYLAIDTSKELIEIAREKQARIDDVRVKFDCSFFDDSFPADNFGLILARFAMEHASDVNAFVGAVHKKLERGGRLAIIEYYVDDGNVADPIWRDFRRRELALYDSIGSHPRLGMTLPGTLARNAFEDIRSCLVQISPSTVGGKAFYRLVLTSAEVYATIDPSNWPESYVNELKGWCDVTAKRDDVDPMFFLTHTTGSKY